MRENLLRFALLAGIFCANQLNAATYFSVANGNWGNASTWSLTSNGAGGAGVPGSGDDVVIERNRTVTVNGNFSCASLKLASTNSNQTGTLVFGGTFTLTVSGNITLGDTGNTGRDGTITFSNNATISAQNISFGGTGGTPGQGIITMAAGCTLNLSGSITVNAGGGTWTPSTGTVVFTGTHTLPTTVFTTFGNVTINGGTTSLGANTAITSALNVTSGTFSANGFTPTITGLVTVNGGTYNASTAAQTLNGGLTVSSGTFNGASSAITVSNTVTTISGGDYNASTNSQAFNAGLNISGGTFTGSSGTVTVTALTLSSGTFTAPSGTFNVTTSFTNNGGTFTPGANTVTFSGAGAKTIGGTSTTTFNNIALNTTGSANVSLSNSIQVNGTVSWGANGLLVLGSNNLTLGNAASITSPNTARYIQVDGTSEANGNLLKTSNGSTASWKILYPIGTSPGGYSPIDFTNVATTLTTAPTSGATLAAKAITSTDATGKLKRTFRITVAGNSNSTAFSQARFSYYDPGDISFSESSATYNTFWYQKESNGVWTTPGGTAPGSSIFIGPSTSQPLTNDTYFFTIGTPTAYGQTYYSYQSGNWNNPLTWTTDGSVFPVYANPTNAVPGAADNVVITSGRTVSMDVNNQTVASVTVTGVLDMLATTGHNFTTISGSGRIRIAGGTDNFPSGTATNFADAVVGGTVEVNGTGISLSTTRTFNNLDINMTSSSNTATLLNNITLNGDLVITNGLFQFNDNSATTNLTLTVNDDVTVSSSGGIRTGTGNARHEFNLYGDFTNEGTSYFTNRTSADYANEATNGIVDVNFLSASANQQVSCNGVTRFYRIEINKGSDDTYKVSLAATASANFQLYGYAAEGHGSVAQLASNANALGLIYGTVELQTNVSIPVLSNASAGNYNISAGAQIWVNGGSLYKNLGNSLVPYGKIRVSTGTLEVEVPAGITTRDNGVIQVDGGVVNTNQIRTSVNGPTNVGSYIQSGGVVTVDGGGPGGAGTDYYVFSLTYTGNVFNMSGGDLIVKGAYAGTGGTRGAIYINSDPANVSVTGGRVIFEISNNNTYTVTSRAAFWNVLMRRTAGTATVVQLAGGDSGAGAAQTTQTIQPLVVLNDLTIESPINFTTNSANLTVSGNLEIQNGGSYTHGTNTTTISGSGVSSLIFGNTSTTQTFNNLTISKTSSSDEAVITTGNATAIRVGGTLAVSSGVFDYSTFTVSARGNVTLSSGVTVGKSAGTGTILLDAISSGQTINSSAASIYNLQLNNTNGITLATGNLTILKTLTLTAGVFNIGTYKLTLSGASAALAGAPFSVTKMIRTAGNTSDGGLELYLDANETLTFPIGVSGKYTPVTAVFTSYSDDGLVKIAPVNGTLQTTNLGGGADILAYYWRVGHSNFTVKPTVRYTFTYSNGDVGGTEANYIPGKVLDESPFTRSSENDVTKVDDTNDVITFNGSGSGFTLENANYTAGGPTRFTGTVEVFYSHRLTDSYAQAWNDGTFWTFGTNSAFGVHDSRQANAGSSPGAGDIAVIGWVPFGDPNYTNGSPHGVSLAATQSVAEVRFTQMLNSSGNPTARVYYQNFQFRPTLCLNNNGGGAQGQLASGTKVSGEGMFWNRSTGANLSDPTFSGVDLGGFNAQDSSYMVYESTLANATYNNMPSTFPNLIMTTDGWGAQDKNSTISTDITVNGNMELLGDVNLILPTGSTGNITVNKNLRFFRSNANGNDSGDGAEIRFGNTGTARTLNILGDLVIGNGFNGSGFVIRVGAPDAGTVVTHTINLYGNYRQNTLGSNTATTPNGNGFKGGTNSANDRIHMNLLGSTSMTLNVTAGDVPQFYSLTVNKGSSIATTAQFNSNFTIDGPTNAATKSLVLTNGLFIINHASANVVLTSGGGDFNIPSTAGLEVRLGTVSTTTAATGANITLDGLLRVSGGTATIDAGAGFANYIEYSNSGNAAIEVTGGTLTVGGQIRRSLTATTGVLKYTQSTGTVVVGNRGALSNVRGVFEVMNTGSQFNHSGGTFTIVRSNGSSTVPSLWLEPASSNITSGSTITIGNASTPASTTFGIQSTATLNNLTISGLAASAPIASMYISPLTVNGNLTVSASNTLLANALNLTIGGNFTVDGTYTSGNNTTSFTNSSAAAISGATPALSFYNFTKSGAGTLTVSKDITVNRDLTLSAGTLATGTNLINLKRHAVIDATMTSTSGSGLIFNGTAQQQLSRSASGTGTLGIVTINNSTGVFVPDGNGYDFVITTNLRLQSGVFDIGGSLLTLNSGATITPVSAFSLTNMIQTNSSYTDKGVRKIFPTNYTTDFTFPVGQLYYTPVVFNFGTSGNTTGTSGTPTITIRPANRRHPSIVNDNDAGELPSPAAFNDLNNVLQYYWVVGATTVANTFKADMTMTYVQSLVDVVSPYTEADYIAARILSDPVTNPTLLVNKFTTSEVAEASNTITFSFNGVTQDGIAGDYFAGVSVAIPNNLPIYTTTSSGDVDAAIYTPVVPGGGAPTGAKVIVASGHTLTLTANDLNLYQTQINAGGKITIPNGSIGHSLGTLLGTGDLEINSDITSAVMPAAIYDTFLSCSGGGLIFGGTGNYEILGGITTVRNLTLNDAGSKSLANNDITICNDLTINAGTFTNVNNRSVTVQNDVLLNGGTFSTAAGTLSVSRDFTQTAGTFNGGTGATKTIARNLTVNGGTFTPGSGSSNIVRVNGDMSVAGGATITTGSGGVTGQKFMFGGSTAQQLTGTFTSTRAFNRLQVNNSSGLTINGSTTVVSELQLTSGLITPASGNFLMESAAIATPTEGSSTSYVNGKLYKVMANGESFIFPIGKGGRWRTGEVNSVTQTGSVTWDMEFFSASVSGVVVNAPAPRNNPVNSFASSDPAILTVGTLEYWRVSDGTSTSSGRTAKVGVSWGVESNVSTNLAQREALKVLSWNGTNWTNNGGTNFQLGGLHTQSRGSFVSTAALSFSENVVMLGSTETANPLPITLVEFNAEIVGSAAQLTWTTASELNNDYFEVQRSTDGKEFLKIGLVNGQGTTNVTHNYSLIDEMPNPGKNYYRLKQVDFDGTVSFSKVVLLNWNEVPTLKLLVHPNPTVQENLNFKVNKVTKGSVQIRLFDLTGQVVYTNEFNSDDMIESGLIKPTTLRPGVYIVEATQGLARVMQRVLITE